MSTNYYFIPSSGPLAVYKKLHIGLRAMGWEFMFQAYLESGGQKTLKVNNHGLFISVDVPELIVKSRKDWQALWRTTPGEIVDESGVPYSVSEFEALVDSLSPGKHGSQGSLLKSHFDELANSDRPYLTVNPNSDWKDEEGFSFSSDNFS